MKNRGYMLLHKRFSYGPGQGVQNSLQCSACWTWWKPTESKATWEQRSLKI